MKMNMNTDTYLATVARLADAFRREVAEELSNEERTQVDAVNEARADDTCATHDYFDANMAMLDAFARLAGRDADIGNAEDLAMMGDAFRAAKRRGFADPSATVQ